MQSGSPQVEIVTSRKPWLSTILRVPACVRDVRVLIIATQSSTISVCLLVSVLTDLVGCI